MRNIIRAACALALLGIYPAYASDYVRAHVPGARLVGQGRAQLLMWDVYDARLYAPNGVWDSQAPFALELQYLQNLKGRKIADHALQEMRRLGFMDETALADWRESMYQIFPDVANGTVITGINSANGPTIFYRDGQEIGKIVDPAFGEQFFRIWLDRGTSTPALRQNLLNLNNQKQGARDESPADNNADGGSHAS